MAALTWRNVDAPDVGRALEGVQQFSQLIGQAFSNAKNGIKEFDQIKTDQVNTALQTQLAAATDPAEVQAIQAQLATNPDAKRFSAESLSSIGQRVNSLLDQQGKVLENTGRAENNSFTEFSHGLARTDRSALDAAKPLSAQLMAAGSSADPAGEAAKIWAKPENQKILSALDPSIQKQMIENPFGIAKSILDIDLTKANIAGKKINNVGDQIANSQATLNLQSGQWEFANKKIDRADQQAGTALVQQIRLGGADADGARAIIAASGASAAAQAYAFAQVGGEYPGLTGPVNLDVGTGISGDPTRIMNFEARASGISAVPDSVKTLGDARDFAKTVNRANKARIGKNGSSAMGLYQIVGDTMEGYASQIYGKDWRSKPFSPAVQDNIAEHIFNDFKKDPVGLSKQWTSLTVDEAKIVGKLPWSQAREYITGGESGASPAQLRAAIGLPADPLAANPAKASQTEVAARQGQNNVDPIARKWAAKANDPAGSDLAKATTQLRSLPAFKDANQNYISNLLETIVKNGGGNYAQAAEIALASIETNKSGLNYAASKIGSLLTGKITSDQPRLPSGYKVNAELVQSNIVKAKGGKFVDGAIEDERLNDAGPKIAAAEAAVTAAQNRVLQVRQAMKRDPRAAAYMTDAMAALASAQANQQLVQQSTTKPQNQFRRK